MHRRTLEFSADDIFTRFMTCPIETHRGFVNTWDCDENAHMNVQHYLRFFDEAATLFAPAGSTPSGQPSLPLTRHVRFHAELLAGALIRILSAQIGDGPFAGWIVHRMENVQTGVLSATALEPPPPDARPHQADAGFAEPALPRSIAIEADQPETAETMISSGGLVTHCRIVQPAHCDAGGFMLQQHYISCFTDGAPHLWEHVNIGTQWLIQHGYGRVAVETKISHHHPVHAGDVLLLHSRPIALTGKIIRFRHELIRTSDGQSVASGEVVALVLDLNTRKAVAMPEQAFRT